MAQRLPHSADDGDLTPSDFVLFGFLKEELTGFDCANRERLKDAIVAIFRGISKKPPTASTIKIKMIPLQFTEKELGYELMDPPLVG
jgi:hypothetical protein